MHAAQVLLASFTPTFAVKNQKPRHVHPLKLVVPLWSTGPPFERQQGSSQAAPAQLIKLVQHPGLLAAMHPRGGRGCLPSTPCAGASFSVIHSLCAAEEQSLCLWRARLLVTLVSSNEKQPRTLPCLLNLDHRAPARVPQDSVMRASHGKQAPKPRI